MAEFNNSGKTEINNDAALKGMARLDAYVMAALSGMLANPAWNSPAAQAYLSAKKLTIEQLAVASAMESIIQLDKFLKGEVGGENDPLPSSQLILIKDDKKE